MTTMSADSDAVRWTTGQVLDWMTNFSDSKEDIRVKILNIVQENDLDGHALKQLRDDPDELHDLLPVLKERLTFRAMMKQLYGTLAATRQSTNIRATQHSPTQSPSTSLESPPTAVSSKNMTASNDENQSHAVLPAFSSFDSSQVLSSNSQPILGLNSITASAPISNNIVEDAGAGDIQIDLYRGVHPTGIISGSHNHLVSTTQTPIYCGGQVQPVSSVAMTPNTVAGGYNLQFSHPETRAVSVTEPSSSHSQRYGLRSALRQTLSYSNVPNNNCRVNVGAAWNATRGSKYSKAHEITQKYKKILQRVRSTSSLHGQEHISYPAPLPTFSPILKHQIEIGNILNFKTRFVYECAQFYMSIDPTPSHAAYRNISMTIISTFPDLADPHNAKEPWRPFNTSLSQAIRNIRRRLRSVPGTGFPPVEPRYQHLHVRRFTPNLADMSHQHQSQGQPRTPRNIHEEHKASVVTTIESPEPILVEADDPIESVDLLDDTTVVSDDYTEKKEIVIKMEDVTSNEEDVIAEEWNNDES